MVLQRPAMTDPLPHKELINLQKEEISRPKYLGSNVRNHVGRGRSRSILRQLLPVNLIVYRSPFMHDQRCALSALYMLLELLLSRSAMAFSTRSHILSSSESFSSEAGFLGSSVPASCEVSTPDAVFPSWSQYKQ